MTSEPKATDSYSQPLRGPSKVWYLVPIFFGIIGGLVMYLVLKDEDRKMAKKGLVLGIILTVVSFVIGIIIGISAVLLTHSLR